MAAMREIWKPVMNAEDGAEVSNLGRLRRISFVRVRKWRWAGVKRLCRIGNEFGFRLTLVSGYQVAHIRRGGIGEKIFLHRLILETFVGPCPAGWQGNHKNGNKMNCRLSNLEYVTKSENMQHAYRLGLLKIVRGKKHHWFGKTGKSNPAYGKHAKGERCFFHGKGHLLSGDKNPNARLNWQKVREIRKQYQNGTSRQMLSKKYGVPAAMIGLIVRNKFWVE